MSKLGDVRVKITRKGRFWYRIEVQEYVKFVPFQGGSPIPGWDTKGYTDRPFRWWARRVGKYELHRHQRLRSYRKDVEFLSLNPAPALDDPDVIEVLPPDVDNAIKKYLPGGPI